MFNKFLFHSMCNITTISLLTFILLFKEDIISSGLILGCIFLQVVCAARNFIDYFESK